MYRMDNTIWSNIFCWMLFIYDRRRTPILQISLNSMDSYSIVLDSDVRIAKHLYLFVLNLSNNKTNWIIMRCSINPEKCEFASNMKDRPNSRCLKYDDAALCPKCLKARKNQSRKAKIKDIKKQNKQL